MTKEQIKQGKELLKEFEYMKDMAKIKALSKASLEQPLTEEQVEKMLQLKKKLRLG